MGSFSPPFFFFTLTHMCVYCKRHKFQGDKTLEFMPLGGGGYIVISRTNRYWYMSTPKLHPWLQRIITSANPQEHYVQLRRFIPGDDTRASDTIIDYVRLQNALGGGGGGAVAIHDWEPTNTLREIELKPTYDKFGPLTELPPGTVIEPNTIFAIVNDQVSSAHTSVNAGKFNDSVADSFYFYWKPEPIQGVATYAHNSISATQLNSSEPLFELEVVEWSGLVVTTNHGDNVDTIPGYVAGQPILIEYSIADQTLQVITDAGTVTMPLLSHFNSTVTLEATVWVIASEMGGASTASASLSSTDIFDSGLTPSPGMSPLELLYDDPLPPAAKPGDFLYVWEDGEWGGNSYEYDQVALVIANGLVQAAAPLGVNRTILQQAIDLIKPQYGDLDVSIGEGGTYPSHVELYQAIGDRALSGERLTVNLRQSPFANAPDVRLHFPTFENVTIRVDRSVDDTLDLGSTNLEIVGGDTPVYLASFNVETLGKLKADHVQLESGQVFAQEYRFNRWGSSQYFTLNVVQADYWDNGPRHIVKEFSNCIDYRPPAGVGNGLLTYSQLTVNSVPLDVGPVTVTGNAPTFDLTSTHPVHIKNGTMAGLSVTYTGFGDESYLDGAPIVAAGGAVVFVETLDYGAEQIRYAVAVRDGGVIATLKSNISGTTPPTEYANQPLNIPSEKGLVMMDTAIPSNAQIIPLQVYRANETVASGNHLASFYVPYPLRLIGARVAVDVAPTGTDTVSVTVTGVGSTPNYLVDTLIVQTNDVANGENLYVAANPETVIDEGTRLIVNVPAVDGTTAKGLTVYLVVIQAELAP